MSIATDASFQDGEMLDYPVSSNGYSDGYLPEAHQSAGASSSATYASNLAQMNAMFLGGVILLVVSVLLLTGIWIGMLITRRRQKLELFRQYSRDSDTSSIASDETIDLERDEEDFVGTPTKMVGLEGRVTI